MGFVTHSPARRATQIIATALWVGIKWMLSPPMYIARRSGMRASWPRRLDAAVNSVVLPLTEFPDDCMRRDVAPALAVGDLIPDVTVVNADGSKLRLRDLRGAPLLLVLVRGVWCSYSRLHLADVERLLPQLTSARVRVLALSSSADDAAWRRGGVSLPLASDPNGIVFDALGVPVSAWMEEAWGRVLPHESTFLFDADGCLVAADVRNVSGVTPGQTFLSASVWLDLAQQLPRE